MVLDLLTNPVFYFQKANRRAEKRFTSKVEVRSIDKQEKRVIAALYSNQALVGKFRFGDQISGLKF